MHEEALRDALVHDDESDLRLHRGLIVDLGEGLAELLDLLLDDLRALSVTHTVTENDEVGRKLPIVLRGEDLDGFLEGLLHLTLDDLTTLRLEDGHREVLAHFLVGARSEADRRLGPSMAHIDSDQHGAHRVHSIGELQLVQVTLSLRVDLLEKVSGDTQEVPLSRGEGRDHLRRDLELSEELLVHGVVVLVAQDYHDDLRVAEVRTLAGHHVVEKVLLDLVIACLILSLDEVGVLHIDLQLNTCFLEMIQDTVSLVVQRPGPTISVRTLLVLVDHDPLILFQMLSFMNGSTLHRLFRALDDLIAMQHHRSRQDKAIQGDRILLNLEAPALHGLLD